MPDPTPVRLVDHAEADEALMHFAKALEEARQRGKWLAVVFSFNEDGTIRLNRTTFGFPKSAFPACVELLGIDTGQAGQIDTSPLPAVSLHQEEEEPAGELQGDS